ncbi:hypothetical protein [Sphingobium fuliginis]|uniref:Uncharacterized protein n=1 Tax=Sphingobium fuliginis ATCC 27551 TaxID=1208342 RepID=A0A5B8CJJ0_SPHSA|nr:hypothetical protein [Sphingobium fuliginis]QDC38386.1 hypothetical protein FIL70_15235 [Sphingobium fuliginis ATCC 27551]
MPVITMPARKCGKSFSHAEHLEIGLLNALFDAGHPMSVSDLEMKLRCTRRDLFRAITAQYRLGNVRKGQPVELTNSGHIAVAAGRYAGAVAVAA